MKMETSCGFLIKQIHTTLEKHSNNRLRADDLTLAQISLLLMLQETKQKEMKLKDIEKLMHLAQSTTVGIVSRLEQKKLVETFTDPQDRRIKHVRITSAGENCCRTAYQNMAEAENALLSGLTETEKILFQNLLQKVCVTLQ